MQKFQITGMSCAACVARVEKAVNQVSGVESCSVNLLTNSMILEGTASEQEIIFAVENAGYGAKSLNATNSAKNKKENTNAQGEDLLIDTETPKLKARLFSSLIFLIGLMYLSMGHTMWNFPLPHFMHGNPIMIALSQLLLTAVIMIINQKFFTSGFKSLFHKSPNMDTLVALGSFASFGYSTVILYLMCWYETFDSTKVFPLMHELYFESAAMILTLITVGKMLESRSKGKTTNALKALMNLAPKTATVIRDEKEITIPSDQLVTGDIFTLRPGQSIPADGIVLTGTSAVNEASLTGESIPSDKVQGSKVYAGTINQSGFLKCQATAVSSDTGLSKIIQMVSDSAATKAPIAKIADKVSGIFVPAVITISLITILIWLLTGKTIGFALARGISVLVISCPCALGLATPVAIMVANGVGAKNGILFKNSVSLEEAGRVKIIAFDKTGTITTGTPQVTDIISKDSRLLSYAMSLESKSEHPLAKAIIDYGNENSILPLSTEDFKIHPGNGLEALVEGTKAYAGNSTYINTKISLDPQIIKEAQNLSEAGKTPIYFCTDRDFLGIIAVSDTIKPEASQAIRELNGMGIKTVMLTGDNPVTARAIAEKAGISVVMAGLLPEQKSKAIEQLKKEGKTCMVGDGINDAPALTVADTGIAIGTGTDVAIDAAQIVLVKNNLLDVAAGIRLSRGTLKNIRQNLFWAFIYNTLGIPLAAGVFIKLTGWELNPMFGALAMSLSSFCVISNALRLNFLKLYTSNKNKTIKENLKMEKTLTIKGMMCPHCEAHVKSALEAVDGVTQAVPSHEKGNAVVTLSKEVSTEALSAAVTGAGYEFISIN